MEHQKEGTAARPAEVKKTAEKAEAPAAPEALSPNDRRRKIAQIEKAVTAKEEELEAKRQLRFEPEYYQDYQKMNELDEQIDQVHNDLAHLMQQWETLNGETGKGDSK